MIAVGPGERRILRARRDGFGAEAGPRHRPAGLAWLLASELFASALGFGVMVHLARRLGPPGFARVEFASAVAAWLLVVVRGGVDVIVYREAARRPRLVRPLTELLIGLRVAAALVGYAIVLVVAALVGGDRGAVVAVAGLMLVPSAFVADVGLRAAGRLRALALAQGVRAVGYAAPRGGAGPGPGRRGPRGVVPGVGRGLRRARAAGLARDGPRAAPSAMAAPGLGGPGLSGRDRGPDPVRPRQPLRGRPPGPGLVGRARARRLRRGAAAGLRAGGAGAGRAVGGVAGDRPRLGRGRAAGPRADRRRRWRGSGCSACPRRSA